MRRSVHLGFQGRKPGNPASLERSNQFNEQNECSRRKAKNALMGTPSAGVEYGFAKASITVRGIRDNRPVVAQTQTPLTLPEIEVRPPQSVATSARTFATDTAPDPSASISPSPAQLSRTASEPQQSPLSFESSASDNTSAGPAPNLAEPTPFRRQNEQVHRVLSFRLFDRKRLAAR